jgi:hypothetical protein
LVTSECLNAPVDLSIDPGTAPVTHYVNDIRLGYANQGGVYLSRPLCEMHGDALCRFVEAHERAHHYTKTIGPDSNCAEDLADCWAAIHSDTEALEAAVAFFVSRRGGRGPYDEPRRRARTIAECATHRQWFRSIVASDSPAPAQSSPPPTHAGNLPIAASRLERDPRRAAPPHHPRGGAGRRLQGLETRIVD